MESKNIEMIKIHNYKIKQYFSVSPWSHKKLEKLLKVTYCEKLTA